MVLQSSCTTRSIKPSSKEVKTTPNTTIHCCLKEAYEDYFPIGVAVEPWSLQNDEGELIKQEFSSITAENRMKMHHLRKSATDYNWLPADNIAEFAQKNGLLLRGHTLCWHDRIPEWFFVDRLGKELSKEQLLARLETHITDVVSRYKGQVYAWDVVNEAISNKDSEFIEPSRFQKICGNGYIATAFKFAHDADPNARLYYNENGFLQEDKRKKICALVKSLKNEGVPIHGIGIQGHWSIYEPTESQLREVLEEVCSLGLKVQITELDISVLSKEDMKKQHGSIKPMTEEQETRQAETYNMLFRVFREYNRHIDGVTFWNVSDRHSWRDTENFKSYPLLFDQNLKPKKAYQAILDFMK